MKKLMFLAVAAIGLVACSKTFEAQPTPQTPIDFSTWANTLTKRAPTDLVFAANDNFNVFGSKTVSATESVVFNGDVVTYNGTSWAYDTPRYWDQSASSYKFYALSPAGLITSMDNDAKVAAAKTGIFTTDDIVFDGTVAKDLLIANEVELNTPPYASPVSLTFNHAASLVDVKVKKSDALTNVVSETDQITVQVTALTLENVVDKGHFATTGYTAHVPTIAMANWTKYTPVELSTSYTAATAALNPAGGLPQTITAYDYDDIAGHSVQGTPKHLLQLVVLPQVFDGTTKQRLKISYKITINGGEEIVITDAIVNIADFVVHDDKDNTTDDPAVTLPAGTPGWEPGKHYIYTLTIDANKINFTASVANWTSTINGYYNLVK